VTKYFSLLLLAGWYLGIGAAAAAPIVIVADAGVLHASDDAYSAQVGSGSAELPAGSEEKFAPAGPHEPYSPLLAKHWAYYSLHGYWAQTWLYPRSLYYHEYPREH